MQEDDVPLNKAMDLMHYRMRVGEGLILCEKRVIKKRRGPSNNTSPKFRRPHGEEQSAPEDHLDVVDRLPLHDDGIPTRCKN